MTIKERNKMTNKHSMPVPTEHQEQAWLFGWAAYMSGKYPMLNTMFAIPNGGKRHYKTAADLKEEGVKPGVSDICLPYPNGRYHGLFIEMKRTKGGVISEGQKNFIADMQKVGYAACVCYGFEQAKETVLRYIKGEYVNTAIAAGLKKG